MPALLAGLLLKSSPAAATDQSISGVWQGRYLCRQGWTGVELIVHANEKGELAGKFKFHPLPENRRVPVGEFAMVGQVNKSGQFEMQPTNWIVQPRDFTSLPLSGSLDTSGRSINGQIHGPGCSTLTLTRANVRVPDAVAALPHGRAVAAASPQFASQGTSPRPEFGEKPVMVYAPVQFDYTDAVLMRKSIGQLGVEPIDQINQWLFESGYKCISSFAIRVGLSGLPSQPTSMRHFGKKRYVIHCSGGCEGLRYGIASNNVLWHFGLSQPYPVMQVNSTTFGYTEMRMTFAHPVPRAEATITVSEWTADPGDYGGGCKGTMFQQAR